MPEVVNPAARYYCGSADAELMVQREPTAVSEIDLLG